MAKTFTKPPTAGGAANRYSTNSDKPGWNRVLAAVLGLAFCMPAAAQMTPDQRRADFEQLAGLVSKAYAPYEWKRDALGFDSLKIGAWLERVGAAKSDLEFWEICAEYMASLQDLHSGFEMRSNFIAEIGVFVDLYDGKALVEFIDRTELPASRYPFQVGDEIVSVDGVTPEAWMDRVSKLQSFANPSATRRWALDYILFRPQQALPRAHEIGANAVVVVRRAETGREETYTIPWAKSGTPIEMAGPAPRPARQRALMETAELKSGKLAVRRAPEYKRLRGFGAVAPRWTPPEGFALRYGSSSSDPIYSGQYNSGGSRIGYLRIPQFPSGSRATTMLRAVEQEVQFFNANTDGLVVDVTRNPGGDVCLTNELLRRMIYYSFRTVGDEFRPTLDTVEVFRADYESYLEFGTNPVTLAYLKAFYEDIYSAYREFRGRTGPMPLPACGFSLDLEPARTANGSLLAYDKPMIVLIDEFTTSSGDVFAAVLQDAGRALMVGKQTAGGGGLVEQFRTAVWGEKQVFLSTTLGVRGKTYQAPGLPASNYIENIGALADIDLEYQTRDNLMNGGRAYVDGFTQAMVEQIRRSTAP